jgi:hypothetical protein
MMHGSQQVVLAPRLWVACKVACLPLQWRWKWSTGWCTLAVSLGPSLFLSLPRSHVAHARMTACRFCFFGVQTVISAHCLNIQRCRWLYNTRGGRWPWYVRMGSWDLWHLPSTIAVVYFTSETLARRVRIVMCCGKYRTVVLATANRALGSLSLLQCMCGGLCFDFQFSLQF